MEPRVTPARAARPRRLLVAVLLSLAFLTGIVGMFAVWVNRQALNTDNWTETSSQLLEDKAVQTAVSAFLVDELFANVDVAGEIQKLLPPQAAALAGPAEAGLREFAGRAAPRLLASPKVQDAWRSANRVAHAQLITILDGGGEVVTTADGVVTLNLRPLVDELAGRLGIQNQVDAARAQLQGSAGDVARSRAQQRLGVTLPPSSGQIEIMRSDDLAFAQDVARVIRDLAVVFTALPLLLFALAVALASGWRRVALRRAGWCFLALGLLVLLGRRVGGDAIVDSLVASTSARPAAESAWAIGTTLLYDIALAMVFYGVVLVAAAWLAGSTRPAVAVRGAVAPALRYQLAGTYGALAILFLLLLAWGPTPATRKPLGILLLAALLVLGVEVLRRQIRREFPDAAPGATGKRVRAWLSGARSSIAGRVAAGRTRGAEGDTPAEAPALTSRFDHLEQLASLHERGVIDDEEFQSQKVLILNAQ